jgi:hypothetical protein
MKKNKIYKYIKFLVIIISFVFLYKNSKENYDSVLNNLNIDYQVIFLSIIIIIIIQNLLNIRLFSFLKLTSTYNANFGQWSSLFYLTGLINQSPFWGAGHVFRSYEMKKNNYSHKEYVNMYFFIFLWGILIYSLILIILSLLFNHINFYTSSLLLILLAFTSIITSKITLKIFLEIFKKFISYKQIKKIKLFDFLFKELLKLLELTFLASNKKVFINFFFFTVFLLFFEYLLLNIIFKFLIQNTDSQIIFLFFLSNFLIRCVKPVDNIVGIKEALLGLYGQQLGLLFLEGALIVLIWRLLGVISLIINYIFYYILNQTLYKKI